MLSNALFIVRERKWRWSIRGVSHQIWAFRWDQLCSSAFSEGRGRDHWKTGTFGFFTSVNSAQKFYVVADKLWSAHAKGLVNACWILLAAYLSVCQLLG